MVAFHFLACCNFKSIRLVTAIIDELCPRWIQHCCNIFTCFCSHPSKHLVAPQRIVPSILLLYCDLRSTVATKTSSVERSLKLSNVDLGLVYLDVWPSGKTERCKPVSVRRCGLEYADTEVKWIKLNQMLRIVLNKQSINCLSCSI